MILAWIFLIKALFAMGDLLLCPMEKIKEGIDDPIHDLKTALAQTQIDPLSFIAPTLGQTIFL